MREEALERYRACARTEDRARLFHVDKDLDFGKFGENGANVVIEGKKPTFDELEDCNSGHEFGARGEPTNGVMREGLLGAADKSATPPSGHPPLPAIPDAQPRQAPSLASTTITFHQIFFFSSDFAQFIITIQ